MQLKQYKLPKLRFEQEGSDFYRIFLDDQRQPFGINVYYYKIVSSWDLFFKRYVNDIAQHIPDEGLRTYVAKQAIKFGKTVTPP
jgi:hypothetical protein